MLSVAERDDEKVYRDLLKNYAEDKIKEEQWERDELEGKNRKKHMWHRAGVAGVFVAGLAGALLALFERREAFYEGEWVHCVCTIIYEAHAQG